MSPQGLQAQAVLQKLQAYNPKRDTKTKSFFKFLSRQAGKYMESGVLPENERRYFGNQFDGAMQRG
jgi:hypothetical protein